MAFSQHGALSGSLPRSGGDADDVLQIYGKAGIDVSALATQLQVEGAKGFNDSWTELLAAIDRKIKLCAQRASGTTAGRQGGEN